MRAAAERARDEIAANGVSRPALRACRAEGDDGTRLARCLKLYVPLDDRPASERPYAFVLELAVARDGAVTLRFIAYGERHPPSAIRHPPSGTRHAQRLRAPTSGFTAATATNSRAPRRGCSPGGFPGRSRPSAIRSKGSCYPGVRAVERADRRVLSAGARSGDHEPRGLRGIRQTRVVAEQGAHAVADAEGCREVDGVQRAQPWCLEARCRE